jgi:hypothetical protein
VRLKSLRSGIGEKRSAFNLYDTLKVEVNFQESCDLSSSRNEIQNVFPMSNEIRSAVCFSLMKKTMLKTDEKWRCMQISFRQHQRLWRDIGIKNFTLHFKRAREVLF